MRELRELHALARAQHGCVTAAQLERAGVSRREIARRLAEGSMRRLHRGVYVLGPVAPQHAQLAAALLAVGPGAVLSHGTAAALYRLGDAPRDIHVTTTRPGPRSRSGIRVHHTVDLPRRAVRRREGLLLTSPERTVLDLAATARDELERAVNEAQVLGLLGRATAGANRRGHAALRAAVGENERGLTRSEAERRLLALIRAAALSAPHTNVRVGRFEVDLLWPAERLVVEVDGFAFHGTRAAFERDRARDAELQARGYRVVRITWRQIEGEPHAVVARLAAALAIAAA